MVGNYIKSFNFNNILILVINENINQYTNMIYSGDTLVMDNNRILHGRTAYDSLMGERYMDQVYLDWDECLSMRRVLMLKYNINTS